jgi:ribosome-associated translation inhibitor RaiA
MAHSDALAAQIERRMQALEGLFDRIISCHVVVELAGHHHSHGDRYRISINVVLPRHELIVSHGPGRNPETAYVAAERAFDEATRQLEDWLKRRRLGRHEEALPT